MNYDGTRVTNDFIVVTDDDEVIEIDSDNEPDINTGFEEIIVESDEEPETVEDNVELSVREGKLFQYFYFSSN